MSNKCKKLIISITLLFVSLICIVVLFIPTTSSEQKPIDVFVKAVNNNNPQSIKQISDPMGLSNTEGYYSVIERYRNNYIPSECTFKKMEIISLHTNSKKSVDNFAMETLGIGSNARVNAVVKITYTTADNTQENVYHMFSFSLEKLYGKYYFATI